MSVLKPRPQAVVVRGPIPIPYTLSELLADHELLETLGCMNPIPYGQQDE